MESKVRYLLKHHWEILLLLFVIIVVISLELYRDIFGV